MIECDGNDIESVINALNEAKTVSGVPTVVIAKTTKGKGVSYMEDQAGWHGKAPDDEQYELAVNELGGEL